jgi:hypothetical protein
LILSFLTKQVNELKFYFVCFLICFVRILIAATEASKREARSTVKKIFQFQFSSLFFHFAYLGLGLGLVVVVVVILFYFIFFLLSSFCLINAAECRIQYRY